MQSSALHIKTRSQFVASNAEFCLTQTRSSEFKETLDLVNKIDNSDSFTRTLALQPESLVSRLSPGL